MGDNRTGRGRGDDESIHIFLDRVPQCAPPPPLCLSVLHPRNVLPEKKWFFPFKLSGNAAENSERTAF
jgi:hypothetical protein